jgi:hypothetical protein
VRLLSAAIAGSFHFVIVTSENLSQLFLEINKVESWQAGYAELQLVQLLLECESMSGRAVEPV